MSPALAKLGTSTLCPGGVCPICWAVLSSWTLELSSALENALSFFLDLFLCYPFPPPGIPDSWTLGSLDWGSSFFPSPPLYL